MKKFLAFLVLSSTLVSGILFSNNVKAQEPLPGYCDNSKRYPSTGKIGAVEVDSVVAKTLVLAYRTKHSTDRTVYKTTGFQITKQVLDNIFEDTDLNTITIDLVESEGALKIVIKGIRSQNCNVNILKNNSIFMTSSFCPTECQNW